MSTLRRALHARAALALAFVALLLAFGAEAAAPKRVLILHSFGREFAPFATLLSAFRTELAQRSKDPITFVDANLDFLRPANPQEERIFLEYLRARFDGTPPDVVVTMGAPAARFYMAHRSELFPSVPVVVGGLDERFARRAPLQRGDAVVAGKIDSVKLIDNILQLLPATERISVVLGTTDLERAWQRELQRDFAPFAGRVKFEWLNDLSLQQIQAHAAKLPPNSAILYGLLVVDAAGVPHEREDALASLHAKTGAPIFGVYESELGKGVVGGPHTSQRAGGERTAAATLRVLEGVVPPQEKMDVVEFEPPAYDWRELERWKIDASRLPPGSTVQFRPLSLWDEHRAAVITTAAVLAMQAMLIGALLLQRSHRRRAETEAEGLAGRLVTAHEDERRRLARELHDDVTQRLAGLAIAAADLEGRTRAVDTGRAAHSIREGLVELGEDVHALSYRLHPSVIEDLGLVEAMRIECDRVAQHGALHVNFETRDVPRKLPADAALCLFRVAQEALRNVERHAHANRVDISVGREAGGLALAVRDNGAGFDAASQGARASLGLASMRERVRLVGGSLHIESAQGAGTALTAWIPLKEAA